MADLTALLERCLKYRDVFIYGDGEVGRLLRVYLHEQSIEASGFITTFAPKRKKLMNLPVRELTELSGDKSDMFVIVCMHKKWWDDAVSRMKSNGLHNYEIIDDNLRREVEEKVLFKDIYEDVEHKINVLLYHRVEDIKTSYSIIVGRENFEKQIKFISSNYRVLRCDEDWGDIKEKSVALTFDDGYVDFYTEVLPILKKYKVPATVFVATAGINNNKEFWWDELENILSQRDLPEVLITKRGKYSVKDYSNRAEMILDIRNDVIDNDYLERDEEIKALRAQVKPLLSNRDRYRTLNEEELQLLAEEPLITIGAHTINHIRCDKESYDVQMREIKESKKILEGIINKDIDLFAYPNGDIGTDTRMILKELGFKRAFTCEHACIDYDKDKFDIPRSAVLNWDSSQLERKFRGMWQTSKDI